MYAEKNFQSSGGSIEIDQLSDRVGGSSTVIVDLHHQLSKEAASWNPFESGGECNIEKIAEPFQKTRATIFRFPAVPLSPIDPNLGDTISPILNYCRDIAVKAPEQFNVMDTFISIGLESRPEVMDVRSGQVISKDVGDLRWKPLSDPLVLPVIPPAPNAVVPGFECLNDLRDIFGIVLEIAVHGDDDLIARIMESGKCCGRLTSIME